MSQRLTDEMLINLESMSRGYGAIGASAHVTSLLVAELRDRRARDLTDEDREELRTVRGHWGPPESESLPEIMEERQRVFVVLDKLLGGAK